MEKAEEGNTGKHEAPELIDVETLAKLLKVSVRFVRRLVAERQVPVHKVNSRVRFDLADILRWLGENKRPAAS
jgi:excisionase family DNA binding protein